MQKQVLSISRAGRRHEKIRHIVTDLFRALFTSGQRLPYKSTEKKRYAIKEV